MFSCLVCSMMPLSFKPSPEACQMHKLELEQTHKASSLQFEPKYCFIIAYFVHESVHLQLMVHATESEDVSYLRPHVVWRVAVWFFPFISRPDVFSRSSSCFSRCTDYSAGTVSCSSCHLTLSMQSMNRTTSKITHPTFELRRCSSAVAVKDDADDVSRGSDALDDPG